MTDCTHNSNIQIMTRKNSTSINTQAVEKFSKKVSIVISPSDICRRVLLLSQSLYTVSLTKTSSTSNLVTIALSENT